MVNKTSKTKLKRLPQGQRKHVRRLKAAARKSGAVPVASSVPLPPVKVTQVTG